MRRSELASPADLHTPWRWGLLLACVAWLAVVASPPFAAEYADLMRWLLHPVCHQIPERSFQYLGEPLAACHRCTGLYVGFTLGVMAWPLLPVLAQKLTARPRLVGAFFVPLLIDWIIADNTPTSRFATGALASFPVALLALIALAQRGGTDSNSPQGVTE